MIDFQARLQRGNVLLKQGDFNVAKQDFEKVVCICNNNFFYILPIHVDKKVLRTVVSWS